MENLEIWTPEQYQAYINGEKKQGSAPGTEKLRADLERKKDQLEDISNKWVKSKEEAEELRKELEKIKRVNSKLAAKVEATVEELEAKKLQIGLYIIGSMVFFILYTILLLAK